MNQLGINSKTSVEDLRQVGPTCTSQDSWVDVCLSMAKSVARRSKDPSTKVGAVLWSPNTSRIVSLGYNGFPSAISDLRKWWTNRDKDSWMFCKYDLAIHAEMNAILNAKADLSNTHLFCTHKPCGTCAKHIAAVGISQVHYIPNPVVAKDERDEAISTAIFDLANIHVHEHIY